MKRLILAFQFLTIFPIKKDVEVTRDALAGSMVYFPVVGVAQGGLLALAYFIFSAGLLPGSVTAGVLLLILVLTNGGLHLDGFADTVDGLAGGKTPEDRLRIMRDSATGAVGVVFVVLLLLLKYLSMEALPGNVKAGALFLFPVVGRWAMVPMAFFAPYARKEGGLGAGFAANSGSTLLKATAMTAVLSVIVLGIFSIILLVILWGVIYMFSTFFKRKIGGVTGDVFGFQSEVAEVLFLIMVLAMTNLLSSNP